MTRQPSSWTYLFHARRHELIELDQKLDLQDWEIDTMRRLAWEQTAEKLRRLGVVEEKLKPPPPPHHSETRSARHPSPAETDQVIATALAQEYQRDKGRSGHRLKRTVEIPLENGDVVIYHEWEL